MNEAQKAWIDKRFTKGHFDNMSLSDFEKTYKGQFKMQIDIKEAAKYLGVGSNMKSANTYKPKSETK